MKLLTKNFADNSILEAIFSTYDFIIMKETGKIKCTKKDSKAIQALQSFWGCTDFMTLLLVKMFISQVCWNNTKKDFKDLTNELNLEPYELFQLSREMDQLKKKGWIKGRYSFDDGLILTNIFLKAIYNSDKSLLTPKMASDSYQVLLSVRAPIEQLCDEDYDDLDDALLDILNVVDVLRRERIGKYILESNLENYEKITLLWIASSFLLKGEEVFDLSEVFGLVLVSSFSVYAALKDVKQEKSQLIKDGYLAFKDDNLNDLKTIELGNELRKILVEDFDCALMLNKSEQVVQHAVRIAPNNILPTTLFFNDEFERKISKLKRLISVDVTNRILQHSDQKNAQTGITMLLHGAPGTGKTELVKQLARQNERVLFMVEVSSIKSMWVGSSEKHLKNIFKDYKYAYRQSIQKNIPIPILLFNEADAIFSKRITVSSSVDQMNNSLQNILLQEMEDFQGIFMATTNNTKQFDEAFDRRFLYKVAFPKPDLETRVKILSNELNSFPKDLVEDVARRYELSGGQIYNIKKKLFLDSMIDHTPDAASLYAYAAEESTFGSMESRPIGFNRAI